MYEARARSSAVCTVNGRKEQLWSAYSNSALCRWEEEKVVEEVAAITEPTDGDGKEVSTWLSGWPVAILVFVLVTILTVIGSVVLGNVAV